MAKNPTLLVVDDEARVREGLKLVLESEYRVVTAGSAEEAMDVLAGEAVDAVLLDLRLPGMDGLEALEKVGRDHPQVPCIMISGHGGIPDAVRAVRLGAYDYIEKPVQPDRLLVTVERALRHRRLLTDLEAERDEARREWRLVGSSPVMEQLRDQISRAAPSNGWVLIEGENGTGKELVARLIHEQSQRSRRPFVRLNSASIPRELVESELFGYEAGAFTGAAKRRKGKLEQAHEGTLFLDEIADMDPSAQAKLLRALGSGEVERLGGSETFAVDVRLICATNRVLRAEVDGGRFREDLYFRIAVIVIRVPPLRDRGDDVSELAEYYLNRLGQDNRRPGIRLDAGALQLLRSYAWPGNVRELRNLMERLVIMHPRDEVTAADLEAHLLPRREGAGPASPVAPAPDARRADEPGPAGPPAADTAAEDEGGLKDRLQGAEKDILQATLERWGWNVTRAAEELGIDRATLHRRMRRLGVHRPGA